MNARKLITTAAALVALIGCSFAAPANANDFDRRLNLQAMQNYMNQRGGYGNQFYGNVNNISRNNNCRNSWNNGRNNGWNNGWNNNGRKWNNGRHNGWNKRWHHRRGH